MTAPAPRPLVLVGAGGHAREVAQLVADINASLAAPAGPGAAPGGLEGHGPLGPWQLLGSLEEPGFAAPAGTAPLHAPRLGPPEWLAEHPGVYAVLAIGQPAVRQRLAAHIERLQPAVRWATLVHPTAWRAGDAQVGEGSVVFPGCRLSVAVQVGRHCILNLGVNLSHDVQLGDFAQLGPGVNLAGAVEVGAAADVGTGVSARPGARIGAHSRVAAGAVVVHPVPPGGRVAGVPARAMAEPAASPESRKP